MQRHAAGVRNLLERVRPLPSDARVLEVGSGAHGLIFCFGTCRGIGVDPLARQYASLFPLWQPKARTLAAEGERLPFRDASFEVVLCDNVVDHAAQPAAIVRELVRVVVPGGLIYFTVNFHHFVYSLAAWLHAAWNGIGLRFEIGPFADHTFHFTLLAARALFADLPVRLLSEQHDVVAARTAARATPPRHLGDRLKTLFFKNALYEVVAERLPSAAHVNRPHLVDNEVRREERLTSSAGSPLK